MRTNTGIDSSGINGSNINALSAIGLNFPILRMCADIKARGKKIESDVTRIAFLALRGNRTSFWTIGIFIVSLVRKKPVR